MNVCIERLYNGIIKENPTFVLMLGMCPTLAVTTSAINGLGMGLTTMVVLALSNLIISLLRNIIPDKVRIPAFIVIIASFVTIVQLLLEAYLPSLNEALGVYIPLIVVNCIILGRAEAYAYFNGPILSLFDGIGMGLGFSFALTLIGGVREILGAGEIFGYTIPGFTPIGIFVLAPGAFFVLAVLCAIQNYAKIIGEKMGKDMSKVGSGCSHDCMNCTIGTCADRVEEMAEEVTEETTEEVAAEDAVEETIEEVYSSVEENAEETVVEEKPKKKTTNRTKKESKKQVIDEEITEETKAVTVTEETVLDEVPVEQPKEEKQKEPKKRGRKKAIEKQVSVIENSEDVQNDVEFIDLDGEEDK